MKAHKIRYNDGCIQNLRFGKVKEKLDLSIIHKKNIKLRLALSSNFEIKWKIK